MNALTLRRSLHGSIRAAGERATVTLRRRHSLLDPVEGEPPTTLLLNGAHAQGATAVNLRPAGKLAGRLVPGLRLTIGGTQYEVDGEAEARANLLAAVPLAAPLEDAAADGAAVTVEAYRDFTFSALYSSRADRLADGTMVRAGDQSLLLAAEGAETTPRSDDVLLVDELPGEVVEVEPLQPGGTALGWRVRRGGRAA